MARWPQPRRRPKAPHRAQGPRAPGEDRPALGELSPSLRNRIGQAHLDRQGYKALARKFSLPRDTIR
ncbi:MAG: Small subunit (SSU) processome component, partial [Watsoniomyces obsoletus]